MKRLTLLRHAKSASDVDVPRDFDRPLSGRGRKGARTIGREMRALRLGFDRVLASPAVRVVETIAELDSVYGAPLAPSYDEHLYLAPVSTLLDLIRATDDSAENLLIVGHNPGLENLALLLAPAKRGSLRAEVAVKYPTGTLAEIALPVEHWSDVREGIGEIVRFIRPRDLDPDLGPERQSGMFA